MDKICHIQFVIWWIFEIYVEDNSEKLGLYQFMMTDCKRKKWNKSKEERKE